MSRSASLRVILPLVVLPLLAVGLTAPAAVAGKGSPGVISSHHQVKQGKQVKRASAVAKAMRIASAQAGDPYRYGAAGPGAFDCSGLVYFAARRAGFKKVPRTSSAQGRFMRHIARAKLRRGDFLFFTNGRGVYHVGFFAGWSKGRRVVLHAPYPGQRVKREPVWSNSWFAATLRGR